MQMILGVDPGLVKTGWGIVRGQGSALKYIACGTIKPPLHAPLAERLKVLNEELLRIIALHNPDQSAIEETFMTANGASTLKLGQARGALLLTLSIAGLPVSEYAALLVKKTVTGVGRAEKAQMRMMVTALMPTARAELEAAGEDAIDALGVAICHLNHSGRIAA